MLLELDELLEEDELLDEEELLEGDWGAELLLGGLLLGVLGG